MKWLYVAAVVLVMAGCGKKDKVSDEAPTETPVETTNETTDEASVETTETPAESTEPVDPSTLSVEERTAICNEKIDAGPCEAAMLRWAFDSEKNACEQFTYGGCQGTRNNFRTQEACVNTCSGL